MSTKTRARKPVRRPRPTAARAGSLDRLALLPAVLGAVAVLAVAPWGADVFALPKLVLALASSGAALVAWQVAQLGDGRWRVPWGPVAVALAVVVVLEALAALTADRTLLSFVGVRGRWIGPVSFGAAAVLVLHVAATTGTGRARTLTRALAIVGVASTALGLLQVLGVDPVPGQEVGSRISGAQGNPNFQAAVLAITLPFVVLEAWLSTGPGRLVGAVLALLQVGALVATESLQGPVAIGAAAVVAGALAFWGLGRQAPARSMVGAGIVGAVMVVAGLAERGPLAALAREGSLQLRRWYWEAGLELAASNPLLGIGPGRFASHYRQARPVEAALAVDTGIEVEAAHNAVIDVAAAAGILAGLAFLAFLALVTLRLRRIPELAEGRELALAAGAAWVAYVVQAMVSIDQLGVLLAGWLAGGLLIATTGGLPTLRREKAGWEVADERETPRARSRRNGRLPSGHVVTVVVGILVVGSLGMGLRAANGDRLLSQAKDAVARGDGLAAIAAAMPAASQLPWSPDPQLELARAYMLEGDVELATAALEELDRRDPRNLEGVLTHAAFATAVGRHDQAIRLMERARVLEPFQARVQVLHGRALLFGGLPEEAEAVLEAAMEVGPQDVEGWLLLARARHELGRRDGAVRAIERALAIDPGNAEAAALMEQVQAAA